jgi:hypothetical protein
VLVDILRQHQLSLYILDQTRADIGLPVYRAIIPSLRHFWPRFGSGRLYTVPLKFDHACSPDQDVYQKLIPLEY